MEMAERDEDVAWVGRANARRKHLLGRQTWLRTLGRELGFEDLEELAAIDVALEENMDENTRPPENEAGGNGKIRTTQETVDHWWDEVRDSGCSAIWRARRADDLLNMLDVPPSRDPWPLPTGYAYDRKMLIEQLKMVREKFIQDAKNEEHEEEDVAQAEKALSEAMEPETRGAESTPSGVPMDPPGAPPASSPTEEPAAPETPETESGRSDPPEADLEL